MLSEQHPDGRFRPVHCNAAYLRLLGCKDIREATEAFESDRIAKMNPFILDVRHDLSNGREVRFETTFNKMDGGTTEVEVSFTPVRDAAGKVFLYALVVRELVEIRRAQAESRHLLESLHRAENAAALGRIVAAWRTRCEIRSSASGRRWTRSRLA
jgi:hypothetical protein